MVNCLVVNGYGDIALAIVRDLINSDYTVYISLPEGEISSIKTLALTNPELDDKYRVIPYDTEGAERKAIRDLLEPNDWPLDYVVALNKTTGSESVDSSDMNLIRGLSDDGVIGPSTSILVGLQTDKVISPKAQSAIEDYSLELQNQLNGTSVTTDLNHLIQRDQGTNDIVFTQVVSDLRRSKLKVKSVTSLNDLMKLVFYYFLPDFLLYLIS